MSLALASVAVAACTALLGILVAEWRDKRRQVEAESGACQSAATNDRAPLHGGGE